MPAAATTDAGGTTAGAGSTDVTGTGTGGSEIGEEHPDVGESDAIFEAREALELGALALTIGRLSTTQLAGYRLLAEATVPYVQGDRFVDAAAYTETNAAFHDYLFTLTGNEHLLQAYQRLGVRGHMDQTLRNATWCDPRCAQDHLDIVTAFEGGDRDAARTLISEHAARSNETTRRAMREQAATRRPAFVTPGRFAGQVVVVTGAAQGIGEAVARRIHAEGGAIWFKPFQEFTPEQIDAEIARSLMTTLYGCRAVLEPMVEAGRGTIVNVSSIATGGIHRVPYAAAKGGVNAITRALAVEAAEHGVRVVATAPGGTEAPPRRVPRGPSPEGEAEQEWFQAHIDQTLASAPMHRYGTLDEQAAAITFLASQEAGYITGTVLPVGEETWASACPSLWQMSDGATASRWVDPNQAASLRDALGELVARPGGLVVVIGPLGSGRDALTDAAVEQVSRRSGLQPHVLRARPGDESLDAGETVVQTVGGGGTVGGDRHEARQGDANAANPPFVVVHDAHLADPDLLVPLVDRAGAPGPDRPTVVLVHDGTLGLPLVPDHRCVVRPLDVPRVQARIDAHGLGHRLSAMRLVEHTAGLADLVEDLLSHLATDLTASTHDVRLGSTPTARSDAHAVVSRLDGPARDVVELVSVLGTLDLDDLAALTGKADPTASVDDAVRSAPVRLVDDGYRVRVAPVAPMLAAAVVEAMPLARRQAAHRRAAAVPQDDLERARHVLRGSALVDEAAVEEVVRLGRGAAQRGDWRRASAALTLAVRTTREADRRQSLLPEALDAAAGAGQLVTADELVPAVSAGPPSVLRDAALGYHAIMVGRPDRAEVCLDQAWRQCNPRTRPAQAVQVAGRRALHALCSWDGTELEQWGARAALLGGDDHASRLEAECIGAIGTAILVDAGRARARLAEILHDHPIGPHRQRVALATGWVELATGDADTAAHRLEDACGRPGDEGSVRIAMWALGWLARARFDAGQWAAAIRLVERGSSLGDTTQLRLGEPLLHWTGAQVNALMGRWAAAGRHAQRAACPVDAYPVMRIPAALARAQVCEARADDLRGCGEGSRSDEGHGQTRDAVREAAAAATSASWADATAASSRCSRHQRCPLSGRV